MFDGGLLCCWIRPDKRRQRAARDAIVLFHEWVFSVMKVPVLIVVTKQPEVRSTVAKLGYREVGTVDRLYGGEAATILSLDRETWNGLEQG